MDLKRGKMERVVSHFLSKSLHIILDSRIPCLRQHDHNGYLSMACRARNCDKWFNLALGGSPATLDEFNLRHRSLKDQMIVDIILVQEEANSSKVGNLCSESLVRTGFETVIERWVIRYDVAMVMATQDVASSACCKRTYQKSIILLQSLYSLMRLLPAHRIFRKLSSSSKTSNFKIIYKVSSVNDPFSRAEEKAMKEYVFAPLKAYPGRLCLSVTYCSALSGLNLEPSSKAQAKYSTDYLVNPTTKPFRYIPIKKEPKGVQTSSSPMPRPHGWISGFHKPAPFLQNQAPPGHPAAHCASNALTDFPYLPDDTYRNRVQVHRLTADQERLTGKVANYGMRTHNASFKDDLDDSEVLFSNDSDDINARDSHSSQNYYGEKPSLLSSELPHSQDAEIGYLVHMLRKPQQLRQDSSKHSLLSGNDKVEGRISTASELLMPQKVSDALEELKSFKHKKDRLLSKSNAQMFSRVETKEPAP